MWGLANYDGHEPEPAAAGSHPGYGSRGDASNRTVLTRSAEPAETAAQ